MKSLVLLLAVVDLSFALKFRTEDNQEPPFTHRYYLLNLESRPQRLKAFWEHLQPSMKDHICRIDAVDASKLTKEDLAWEGDGRFAGRVGTRAINGLHKNRRGDWKDLNDGALGCFLSHTKAWDQMVEDDVDVAVIVEDDNHNWSADYEHSFQRLITSRQSKYDHNWDVILMSHCGEPMGDNSQMVPGGSACTGAMAVSRAGVRKLLDQLLPIETSIDHQLNLVFAPKKEVNFFRAVPKMGEQAWFGSDVQTDAYWVGGENWHADPAIFPAGTKELTRVTADPHNLIPDCVSKRDQKKEELVAAKEA